MAQPTLRHVTLQRAQETLPAREQCCHGRHVKAEAKLICLLFRVLLRGMDIVLQLEKLAHLILTVGVHHEQRSAEFRI